MSEGREIPENTRRSLLAGMMMALLAGSVGIAWWLAESRGLDPQAASEILAGIRRRGLPAFWGDESVENWYMLRRADGRPVGWSVSGRLRGQTGGYVGTRVGRTGNLFSKQDWVIDDAARTGKYVSRQWPLRPGMPPTTEITFENGVVTVAWPVALGSVTAKARAPEDYIPEGLTDLVMYQTAVRGRKTKFSMLIDDRAIRGGQVVFEDVRVTPEGGRAVRREFADSRGEMVREVMVFDETGGLLRVTYPRDGLWEEASSAEDVIRVFPEAAPYRKRGSPGPATAEEEDSGPPSEESAPPRRPGAATDASGPDASGQEGF